MNPGRFTNIFFGVCLVDTAFNPLKLFQRLRQSASAIITATVSPLDELTSNIRGIETVYVDWCPVNVYGGIKMECWPLGL